MKLANSACTAVGALSEAITADATQHHEATAIVIPEIFLFMKLRLP
jgi:hypothetical protein